MSKSRIVYMGTPEFAVTVLAELIKHGENIVGVITAPDKAAGRGRKISQSAVKKYADIHGIKTLQPTSLKDASFLDELTDLNADLQIVVAFRMLPEVVWGMPKLGTFNLHASWLPKYRGAAPINWAIINGEIETGVTTFFLNHEIDKGAIIMQEKVSIKSEMNAGTLHDLLANVGSKLVTKTCDAIASDTANVTPQNKLKIFHLPEAPKIFKKDCRIDWNNDTETIFNLIRGLSPYPGSWTIFETDTKKQLSCKIFDCTPITMEHNKIPGSIITDNSQALKIACKNGYITLNELQIEGKKRMKVIDFLRGSRISNDWKAI
ncbi:MAG: methionyl-tRNA formyltransferase [Flavobacteriales bacterium]|nr:methionyl-tRNA formyltransferase [Flavobacteriales bacterium]